VGKYELVVSNKGYKTHKESIKLTANDVVPRQLTLIKGSDKPKKISPKWEFGDYVDVGGYCISAGLRW
jgi:hypothetical protein